MAAKSRYALERLRQPAHGRPAQTLNEVIAAEVQSLTGDPHRAQHLAWVQGGPPQLGPRHPGYRCRRCSLKCQVHLRDRRLRHHRHPSPRSR